MTALGVRIRIDFGPERALGPGKVALLEGMQRTGSLSQTAREMGMSYRRAWLLLQSLNALFDQPIAVATKGGRGGGGVELTPLAVQVIAAYRRLENGLAGQAEAEFKDLGKPARRSAARAPVKAVAKPATARARRT